MKFKYVGPHDAVDLVGHGEVARGQQVDVTGADAESLSKQADWKRASPRKPSTNSSTNTTAAAADKTEE